MTDFTQANRPFRLTTPLGPDALILVGFEGTEAVSELFHFRIEALAPKGHPVPFGRLLGQNVRVEHLTSLGAIRYFHGIVSRVAELDTDEIFTAYELEMVPFFWLRTQNLEARIFQNMTVPAILAELLRGAPVTYQLQEHYLPHNYCVQYLEPDFAFASRLMEEEGIFYYFEHTADAHTMVVADRSRDCPAVLAQERLPFLRGTDVRRNDAPHAYRWRKQQQLRASRWTVADHSFELPSLPLTASRSLTGEVVAGTVTHALAAEPAQSLEVLEYPADFAHRFDAVGPGGEDRPTDMQLVFEQRDRTAVVREQELAAAGLSVEGHSNASRLMTGHRFTLEGHPNADGEYLLTRVTHSIRHPETHADGSVIPPSYTNRFVALPRGLPYRPPRTTTKPRVGGSQTATVVGPKDIEVFCDKYGRVKVHFHWDRHGQSDGRDSCWLRVGTNWAGKGFGLITLPRIGQEVIVDFLDGDPDRPLITGAVYNTEQMVPFRLPEAQNVSVLKTHTVTGAAEDFHGLAFNDSKGQELLEVRSQKDMLVGVKNDHATLVPRQQYTHVGQSRLNIVGGLSIPGSGSGGSAAAAAEETGDNSGGDGKNSSDSQKESSGDQEPLEWGKVPVEATLLAFKVEAVYGAELGITFGNISYYDIGLHTDYIFDPVGVIGQVAATYVPGLAGLAPYLPALGGAKGTVYGSKAELHWGTATEIQFGPKVELHRGSETGVKLLAGIHCALAFTTATLPGALTLARVDPILIKTSVVAAHLVTQIALGEVIAVGTNLGIADELEEQGEQATQLGEALTAVLGDERAESLIKQVKAVSTSATDLIEQGEEVEKYAWTTDALMVFRAPQVILMASGDDQGILNLISGGQTQVYADGGLTVNVPAKSSLVLGGGNTVRMNCTAGGNIVIGDNPLTPNSQLSLGLLPEGIPHALLGFTNSSIAIQEEQIIIKCGNSSITLTSSGITFDGLNLKFNFNTIDHGAASVKTEE